jgi:hypothetical protein
MSASFNGLFILYDYGENLFFNSPRVLAVIESLVINYILDDGSLDKGYDDY